jgi:hypothetical protein
MTLADRNPTFFEVRSDLVSARRSVETIVQEAARLKVPVRAVVFPYLKPPALWTDEEKLEHATIVGLLRDRSIPFLDLKDKLPAERLQSWREQPDDQLHFNRQGSRALIRPIWDFLMDHGLADAAR